MQSLDYDFVLSDFTALLLSSVLLLRRFGLIRAFIRHSDVQLDALFNLENGVIGTYQSHG